MLVRLHVTIFENENSEVERHDEHLFCEKVVGGSKFWRKWRGVLVMPLHFGGISGFPPGLMRVNCP
jgi:hypothetical protein